MFDETWTVRFYIDPETGQPHVLNHGVTEREVREVLMQRGEDRPGKEGARIKLGQTEEGRYLRVVYTLDDQPRSMFVITALELKGKPLTAYRARRRRQGG